jgi:hypothetical protein
MPVHPPHGTFETRAQPRAWGLRAGPQRRGPRGARRLLDRHRHDRLFDLGSESIASERQRLRTDRVVQLLEPMELSRL